MKSSRLLLIAGALVTTPFASAQAPITALDNPLEVNVEEYLSRIELPDGFNIAIYASGMDEARSLAVGDDGTLYVGTRGGQGEPPIGKVYAIPNQDGDDEGDEVITILEGLFYPNGLAFHDGDLYVAEINRVLKYEDISGRLRDMPEPVVLVDTLPEDYLHGWKYIAIGPDDKLYVPVGAPCNTCLVEDPHGTILRMDLNGSNLEVYARGVRNTVGFDFHPVTGELWFTDNGRDLMGNDLPPEELNVATEAGQHFGFPYRYGMDLVDPEYETDRAASEFTPAVLELPAHNAGLGVAFYTGTQFPDEYRNQLFAAYHGSWNRNPIDGYNLRLMRFEDNKAVSYEEFATGWLQDNSYWGRPVDVKQAPDGALLVSDDFNGVVYRISYGE